MRLKIGKKKSLKYRKYGGKCELYQKYGFVKFEVLGRPVMSYEEFNYFLRTRNDRLQLWLEI